MQTCAETRNQNNCGGNDNEIFQRNLDYGRSKQSDRQRLQNTKDLRGMIF